MIDYSVLQKHFGVNNAEAAAKLLFRCVGSNAESHVKGVSAEIYGEADLSSYFDLIKAGDNDKGKRYDYEIFIKG